MPPVSLFACRLHVKSEQRDCDKEVWSRLIHFAVLLSIRGFFFFKDLKYLCKSTQSCLTQSRFCILEHDASWLEINFL